jgi:methylthioribose-1-phosphate isomerase
MLARIDQDLAFLLRLENVAWYDQGIVRILDRRIYPIKTGFVECHSYHEVVEAIKKMVTQSGGPYLAASMGMVLAAYEARDLAQEQFGAFMKQAANDLAHARPTTSARMARIVENALQVVEANLHQRSVMVEKLQEYAIDEVTTRYMSVKKIGTQLADLIPENGTVMTQCFAETVIGMILLRLRELGNIRVKFICPETRPYLQGARLTASVIRDMGFEVTVITDNMPGYVLKEKKVDLFTSAADMITMDGYVVNKIGTFQIALLCNYYGIPYFVTGNPNSKHQTIASVKIEERNPQEVLEFMGKRTTMEGVKGYYPAFDITPPSLCSGVITDRGIFAPFALKRYYQAS